MNTVTDHELELVGLGVAVFGVIGTWLAVPQLREWWHARREASMPITLGSLANAKPRRASGTIKADQQTLEDILTGLPSSSMQWLHEQNFGDGFWLSRVLEIEHFVLSRGGPEHEFLNKELEGLRTTLWASVEKFTGLIAIYTFNTSSPAEPGSWMRIMPRDEYDADGNYTNREFFRKAQELNDAAEEVWNRYRELIGRARLVLASGDGAGGEE